jgi:hypothetical protein
MKNLVLKGTFLEKCKSDLVKISVVTLILLVAMFGMPDVAKAQIGPSIEVPTWAPYIMIGKNDVYNDEPADHILTFGKGNPSSNCGLWYVRGSFKKGFNIGRTNNMTSTTTTSGSSAGRRAIFIDSNINIGIDKWETEISYKLDVPGAIRVANTVYTSDRRYKRDIKPISNLDNLFKINSVQYKPSGEALKEQLELFKKDYKDMNEEEFNAAVANYERQIVKQNSDTTTHFGFIAQELREVYPNLVSEDRQGFLSVNYTELIPVLVDAIKELKTEINELKGNGYVKQTTDVVMSNAKLYQNNPNPWTENTEIKFYVPEESGRASICIYDLVGSEIMKLDLNDRGYSTITIHGSQLKAGMYLYALLVDGKEIDTKRMILTNN